MHDKTFHIDGMACSHCIHAVREALKQIPNVQVHEVTLGKARVSFDTNQYQEVRKALEDAGYTVRTE